MIRSDRRRVKCFPDDFLVRGAEFELRKPLTDPAILGRLPRLVTGVHLHHIALQRRLALWAAVEHVSARILLHLDPLWLPITGIWSTIRTEAMNGTRQITPAMHDQHVQLRVDRHRFAQLLTEPRSIPLELFSLSGASVQRRLTS